MENSEKEFLVFGAPAIEQPEIDEVVDCMNKGWLGTGPKAARFEKDFAAYKGIPCSAAVSSCTAALHLSHIAAGLGPGDEVITTPMTFCATVNAIIHTGATPVLADVNPETMNIDPEQIEHSISRKTKAILPVHFAGRCCDMDPIMKIARDNNLRVIEDCAHAIETEYHGTKAGTFGDFGCFSFYTTKNVMTGEGGMVITHDEEALSKIKIMALHGMSKDAWKRFSDTGYKHYQVVDVGFKYNMMDIQAAMGIHQLKRVEKNWMHRMKIWKRYQEAFAHLPVTCPAPFEPDTRHALHLYTLLIDEKRAGLSRDQFLDAMTGERIGVGVHYVSIPEHPYYQKTFGWNPDDFPHAKKIGRETVSLPLSAKLTDEDVERVIRAVYKALS
jgi:dTDP-4-amino-4,6-dideoxygalactose transaminase